MAPTPQIVENVDRFIERLLSEKRHAWASELEIGARLVELAQAYMQAGGKRLRTQFCFWAFTVCGGDGDSREIVRACAAVELLHAFALVHDDVMDGAELRREKPTPHIVAAAEHEIANWSGESRRYGEGLAILLGDYLFANANALAAELDDDARQVWTQLSEEVVVGQFLDMHASASRSRDAEVSLNIARYKSGKYSVERPMHLGAAVARTLDKYSAQLSAIGIPLGEAFQLRDDVLGVTGDSTQTGKPVGGDIREGKPTLLLAFAWELASPAQRLILEKVGQTTLSTNEVDTIVEIFKSTGAIDRVEDEIQRRVVAATSALSGLSMDDSCTQVIESLISAATTRSA